jgi:hypothetical protein
VGFVIEKGCPAGGREPVPMPGPGKVRVVVQASRESSPPNELLLSNIILKIKLYRR